MTVHLGSRGVVVIALLMLTASNWPREARAQGVDELASPRSQVNQLYSHGKYAEAAPIAERYVALVRQKHGDNHIEYATAIAWLAYVYEAQGRYAEATRGSDRRAPNELRSNRRGIIAFLLCGQPYFAAPTFVVMALCSAVMGGPEEMICSSGDRHCP
jgi:hypothetical protein